MDLIIISFILASISFLILLAIWNGMVTTRVKEHSKLYHELNVLNEKYKSIFFDITQNSYSIVYSCKSLQMYNNRNNSDSVMSYLSGYMREQGSMWRELHRKAQSNYKNKLIYQEELNLLNKKYGNASYTEVKGKLPISEDKYIKQEDKVCSKNHLSTITDIEIICLLSYISPKGQNSYSSTWTTNLNNVFLLINERSASEQSIEYQRSLMTSSKRYDILRRDNFCCKICGRSANDGAKLEVDHIIPVSRGGKTKDDNLQTLCRECNQGKKAKL